MAQTYSALRDLVEQILQDTSNGTYSTAELDLYMADALREVASYVPYRTVESFTIESRTGTATSTSSGNLVDAGESQFVSGDVGKYVYNKTDKTWAVIKTYTSATTVALSKDIMASGEEYAIFNTGCWKETQINIANITDRLWNPAIAEYPIGVERECEVIGDILELTFEGMVDDSKALSSGTQPDTEVLVHFDKRHRVSQLTDSAAAVNYASGYAAGTTSMAIDALQATGTIEADQEFTIANTRGTYRVTTAATISSNAATVSFYPGLESAVTDDTVVTLKASTLTPYLEVIFADLVAGRAAISKARSNINAVNIGNRTPEELLLWGKDKVNTALARLRGLMTVENSGY